MKTNLADYRLGAITAHNVLRELGWAFDASTFAQTCRDPQMMLEVGSYSRASFESFEAWMGFRHALGFPVTK